MKDYTLLCSMPHGHSFAQLFERKMLFTKPEYGVNPYALIKTELEGMGCRLVDRQALGGREPDAVVHFRQSGEFLKEFPRALHIYLVMEPEIVCPTNSVRDMPRHLKIFDYLLSMYDDTVDGRRIFPLRMASDLDTKFPNPPGFHERKLLASISANKFSLHPNELYSARWEAIGYFEREGGDDFDFYGYGWKGQYRNYKGTVDCKLECLSRYKYALCFENIHNVNGSVSEKIFDCFFAGCVPVYYGMKNVRAYIPEACFIDYEQFGGIAECAAYLKDISPERWRSYLDAIREYLRSPQAQVFSPRAYAGAIADILPRPRLFDSKRRSMGAYQYLRLKRGAVARLTGLRAPAR